MGGVGWLEFEDERVFGVCCAGGLVLGLDLRRTSAKEGLRGGGPGRHVQRSVGAGSGGWQTTEREGKKKT